MLCAWCRCGLRRWGEKISRVRREEISRGSAEVAIVEQCGVACSISAVLFHCAADGAVCIV